MTEPLNIVILGLSITSSWANAHATVYRSLIRALTRRGHPVLFLERDTPGGASGRDLPTPSFGRTEMYHDVDELKQRFSTAVRTADLVIVGSFVPDGVEIGRWVCQTTEGIAAFYDIDTPVTLAKLRLGEHAYLTPELIRDYQLYLSVSGGPILQRVEREYGSPMARPLYCCFDPEQYYPEAVAATWDLGYMGTYSEDRQPRVERLMLEPARRWTEGRFIVAGPQYPQTFDWPANTRRIDYLPPAQHAWFYNRQRFTLNITRDEMMRAGYSPGVRLFEAAACGTPIISDMWEGLNHFFEIGREILVAQDPEDTLRYLREMPESQRIAIGLRARQRVLTHHTAAHRAAQLEAYVQEVNAYRLASHQLGGQFTDPVDNGVIESNDVQEAVGQLAPWFHNLHLPDGTQTAPDHVMGDFPACRWVHIADHLPRNLTGWNVLDIGCNAGFYSLEMARRGATVLAIDCNERCLAQARWAAKQYDLHDRITFYNMQVYELAHLRDEFDLVLFMGVFYHLRYPLLGLDIVAEKVRRLMVFQSMTMPGTSVYEDTAVQDVNDREAMLEPGWPKMAFIEHRLAGDATNWWAPNHAGIEAMLRSAGMQVIGRPAQEIYLCQPDPSGRSATRPWDRDELLAATGRSHRTQTDRLEPRQRIMPRAPVDRSRNDRDVVLVREPSRRDGYSCNSPTALRPSLS